MRKNISLIFGMTLIFLLTLLSLFAPLLSSESPGVVNLSRTLIPPSLESPFGYDSLGGNLWSKVLYGGRISLFIALTATCGACVLGVFFGSIAGYLGGKWDMALMRLCDVVFAFPGILLAIAIIAVCGSGIKNVIFALILSGWAGYARLVRGEMRSLKFRDFVVSARAIGVSPYREISRHILPSLLGPLLVQVSFGIAGCVIAESSLSFLGLGTSPDIPSWGTLLKQGKEVMLEAPHVALFPGLSIALLVLGFHQIGDGLVRKLNPR